MDELGVHGEGGGLRQIERIDLLPNITRDELDGRLHVRNDALGLLDALQAALAEPFVLAIARACSICPRISAAMSWPFRRTPRSRSTK